MKALKTLIALSVFAVIFGTISAPEAMAQIQEASYLRITEPLDIGGTVLEPGVYVIRVLPSIENRNSLQVTNEDRSKVYATVLSIPHALPSTTHQINTEFVYYPATSGSPRALRTWFAPNATSHGGHDVVYPERRALELAVVVKEPVVAYKDTTPPEELKTAELVVVTPEKVVAPYVEPTPAPAPAPAVAVVAETRELPHTASRLPLFATLGALMLCAAIGIRALRTM